MPEKLKNIFFTKDSLILFADAILEQYPKFDKDHFLRLIFDNQWDSLELKEKMRHTTKCLHEVLPQNYIESLVILIEAAPKVKGFEAMSLPDYVEVFGMNHWEESLNALGQFTRYYSSEFAIRPFLDQDPGLVMEYMRIWARSKHENVRRFASEGCRPRLPWAMALPKFIRDPKLVLEVLEILKNDDSEFVRKSVANNLNDISKDNPEIVLKVAERWLLENSKNTNWIVKHGLRTLLKHGNTKALRLFGFGDPEKLEIVKLKTDKVKYKIGDNVFFTFDLLNAESQASKVRLEYAIDYIKANGKSSHKIFQIIEKQYEPGSYKLNRKQSFANMSTRKHYPGNHRITILINGIEKGYTEFILSESKR